MMDPIKKYTFTETGKRRVQYTLDPFGFVINSIAMGDVIALVPVIKYMVDNFYTDPATYRVVAKKHFREFFPFVPDSSFEDFDIKDKFWNIPDGWPVGVLNRKNDHRMVRNTPKRLILGQYAGLMLVDRLIPVEHLNYVPLVPVDVSHFGIDFTNSVILISSFRDETRAWHAKYIIETAKWLKGKGITPIFVGKTDMDLDNDKKSIIPKTHLPADVSAFGLDLRNKTTIPELASIMGQAKAVCGVDSGPIHLAGTTSVPIICGYTSVSPEFRIPIRKEGKTYPIVPDIECVDCESRWRTNYWNFENCYNKHIECVNMLTSKRYIEILETLI